MKTLTTYPIIFRSFWGNMPVKVCVLLVLIALSTGKVSAQHTPYRLQLEAQAIGASSGQVPFWFRARQGGSVPQPGVSGSFLGFAEKMYDTTAKRTFDWGFGLEGRANLGQKGTDLLLIQGYAKAKLAMFEVKAGRWRGQSGLADTLLSTGAFAISGNALGIPQVQIAIPEFYALPFTNGWFSIKGSLSHGWFGVIPLQSGMTNVDEVETFFHHKSFYGRLGKDDSRVNLYGGFNHQVFWGNEPKIFGSTFIQTTWESYKSILLGEVWAESKVGNHLGSIDLGLGLNLNAVRLLAYRQFFYEVGALAHLANISDGLNGLSFTNMAPAADKNNFRWEKALIEILYSKSQAGKLSSPVTHTGHENYYNHYLYSEGWTYRQRPLGNPLFTPKHEARPGQVESPGYYFINNKILAFHGGLTASWRSFRFQGLLTYSKNYGLYSTGNEPYRVPFKQVAYPSGDRFFEPVNQFSGFLSVENLLSPGVPKKLNYYWGAQIGVDAGRLLNSSAGVMLKYGFRF